MNDAVKGPDELVERVAKVLREPVRASDDFAARVMSNVRESMSRSWWRRPMALHVSPLMALAATIMFVAAIVSAEAGVRRMTGRATADARTVDTIVLVRFVLTDAAAQQVSLVGSFNQWRKDATPLRSTGVTGAWTVTVALPRGRHEYAFVVSDGRVERWTADPLTPSWRDEFGNESSVVSVNAEDLK